jgi:hypothetical protein
LIGLGFDFHGFTALTVQIEYVAESREAPLQGWMRRSNQRSAEATGIIVEYN